MTISIERGKKKSKPKSKRPRLGFTNWLAVCIMIFLAAGLAGGFYLARLSIVYGYTGALACYTAAFAPIGTACSVVLSKIVHKSEVETLVLMEKELNSQLLKHTIFVRTA